MIPVYYDKNLQTMLRSPGGLPTPELTFDSRYRIDSSVVDVDLARNLYFNRDERYKLGAGFARPAINVPVGFMGLPMLTAPDDLGGEAQEWLDRAILQWTGQIAKAHQMALRDGEVLVRLHPANRSPAYEALFEEQDKDTTLTLVPSEAFEILAKDEDIEAIEAVTIKHVFMVEDQGSIVEKELYETITAEEIVLKYRDDFKEERKFKNEMGFVPAVLFENESEIAQLHASSELEAMEPYMKFYHDVMVHAGSSSELHSTAKLVIRARDLDRFLSANFTDIEITEKRLRFRNKDVLFFESGDPSITSVGSNIYQEGAEIIQAEAPLGDTTTLLEFIFLNIVDVSEIPEWAFGGAIGSSKASVSEQSAPLVHKVKRKRAMVESGWALLGRMMLKTVANMQTRVEVRWSDLAMRDLKSEAEAFRNFTEALLALNDGQSVSKTTMNKILMKILPEILPYDLSDDPTESDMVGREVEAKMEQAVEFAAAMGTDEEGNEEGNDRQTGINAVE